MVECLAQVAQLARVACEGATAATATHLEAGRVPQILHQPFPVLSSVTQELSLVDCDMHTSGIKRGLTLRHWQMDET